MESEDALALSGRRSPGRLRLAGGVGVTSRMDLLTSVPPPAKKLGVLSFLTLVRRDESTFSALLPFSKLENQFRCLFVKALMFGRPGVEDSEMDFPRLSVSESTEAGIEPLTLPFVVDVAVFGKPLSWMTPTLTWPLNGSRLFSSEDGLSRDDGVPAVTLPYGLIDRDRTEPDPEADPTPDNELDDGTNLFPMSEVRRS